MIRPIFSSLAILLLAASCERVPTNVREDIYITVFKTGKFSVYKRNTTVESIELDQEQLVQRYIDRARPDASSNCDARVLKLEVLGTQRREGAISYLRISRVAKVEAPDGDLVEALQDRFYRDSRVRFRVCAGFGQLSSPMSNNFQQ